MNTLHLSVRECGIRVGVNWLRCISEFCNRETVYFSIISKITNSKRKMQYFSVLLFFLAVSHSVLTHDVDKNPELQLADGKIRGSIITSRLGKNIFSYRGLRYAEPPTNERRFKVIALHNKFTNDAWINQIFLPAFFELEKFLPKNLSTMKK